MFKFKRIILKLFKKILALLISLSISVIIPINVIIISPIIIVRWLVSKFCKLAGFGQILTARSSLIAVDDLFTRPTLTLVTGLLLDGEIDFETLRQAIIDRLINFKDTNGKLLRPELQQYICKQMGFLFWKQEKNFSVDDHLRIYPNSDKRIEEPRLLQIIRELIKIPFSPGKSLWEFVVVRNFYPQTEFVGDEPKNVVLFRIHHCMGDGMSIFKLLLDLVGHVPIPVPKAKYLSKKLKWTRILTFPLKLPFEIGEQLMEGIESSNAWHNLSEKEIKKDISAGMSNQIPLSLLKEIKEIHHVPLSSVIVSGIGGGIRRFLIHKGIELPKNIILGLALPGPSGNVNKLRNNMSGSFIKLPIGIKDSAARLNKINSNLEMLKNSLLPIFGYYLIPIGGAMPYYITKILFKNVFATALMTNMPGPQEQLVFFGRKILTISFGSGLLPGNAAIGFTVLSYNQTVTFACGIDQIYVESDEEVDLLIKFISSEFKALRDYQV